MQLYKPLLSVRAFMLIALQTIYYKNNCPSEAFWYLLKYYIIKPYWINITNSKDEYKVITREELISFRGLVLNL
jgi:hypothetical protein